MEQPLQAGGAYNARPHETVHGAPEDVEKQPATEFRVLQDNADKFQHNKDLTDRRVKAVEDAGAFRAPTNAARSFNPQYGDVQRLGAVDSVTVRSTEGLPGEDVHHHQAVLRLPPRVLAEVDEVGLQPVVGPLGGRLAQRARPGRAPAGPRRPSAPRRPWPASRRGRAAVRVGTASTGPAR